MRAKPWKQWRQGLLIGVLLLVIFWLASSIINLLGKARLAVSEAHEAQWQYEALKERKEKLEESLATLATERGRDSAIRTAFGVARSGEEVIVVVPPLPEATTTPTWWERFVSWF